jgi:hypothetical protein
MADRDYEVGYGKPPQHTRFRKGQSGNPRGRPRGVKTAGTLLREILYRKVTITEDGRHKQTTVIEAFFLRQVQAALKGDARASDRVLKLLPVLQEQLDQDAAQAEAQAAEATRDDRPVLAALAEMMGASAADLFVDAQREDDDAG